jgi:hypothetical protein
MASQQACCSLREGKSVAHMQSNRFVIRADRLIKAVCIFEDISERDEHEPVVRPDCENFARERLTFRPATFTQEHG